MLFGAIVGYGLKMLTPLVYKMMYSDRFKCINYEAYEGRTYLEIHSYPPIVYINTKSVWYSGFRYS